MSLLQLMADDEDERNNKILDPENYLDLKDDHPTVAQLINLIGLYNLSEEFRPDCKKQSKATKIIKFSLIDDFAEDDEDKDEISAAGITAITVWFYQTHKFIPEFTNKLVNEGLEARKQYLTEDLLEFISTIYDPEKLGFDHLVPISIVGYFQVFDYYIKNINPPLFNAAMGLVEILKSVQEDTQDEYITIPRSLINKILDNEKSQ